MNYKALAASCVVTLGLLGFALSEAFRPDEARNVTEKLTSASVEDPATASSAYIAPDYEVSREPSPRNAAAPMLMPDNQDPDMSQVGAVSEAIEELKTGNGSFDANSGPKIAYRFGYGFRLPGNAIKSLQERHADMCEARGSNVCRIIAMEQSDGQGGYATGSLQLAVASPVARAFGKDLTSSAEGAEAELVSSSIDGEDLSKNIVDTQARLRARTLLRDRLMDVLENRRGTVTELIEAERGVAQVNEEIDRAQSWLSEMRGRVEFAQVRIDYSAGEVAPEVGGFSAPVGEAFSSAGSTLGYLLAALIRLVTVLGPLALLAWLAVIGWRKLGRPGSRLARGIGERIDEVPA
ncbi:DUF4349 domain-containing protein [Parerythrobacter lacustris]|uniref:DUF4349 domain-containing protein n=1 Tax=Parerythrobacter lacustris TaxID=2969984 RepID=A0ABT1XX11_9SPHN|nr:DUF4349 domain-containing protein [Parerythrobacter lacustris]MCR2834992.1 DUF4349 domain-containing protein [Parerythrobacter lacustris]